MNWLRNQTYRRSKPANTTICVHNCMEPKHATTFMADTSIKYRWVYDIINTNVAVLSSLHCAFIVHAVILMFKIQHSFRILMFPSMPFLVCISVVVDVNFFRFG